MDQERGKTSGRMEAARGGPLTEAVSYWRPRGVAGLELMTATFRRQNFARHFHPCYAFGVIEQGAMAFRYLGSRHLAHAGQINLVVPGEAHDGHAAGAGWRYRMFYLDPSHLRQAASEMAGKPAASPFFRSGVLADPRAARGLRGLHLCLEAGGPFLLEQQASLLELLAGLISRHAAEPPTGLRHGAEPKAVRRAKEFLEARASLNPSLDELSQVAGLTRYHLLRVFKSHTGLTPHAYLDLLRVNRARQCLDQGHTISEAALAAGYSDQSHLNRRFKRIFGITPGQYRNSVQDR